jgi:hypothetical protein
MRLLKVVQHRVSKLGEGPAAAIEIRSALTDDLL